MQSITSAGRPFAPLIPPTTGYNQFGLSEGDRPVADQEDGDEGERRINLQVPKSQEESPSPRRKPKVPQEAERARRGPTVNRWHLPQIEFNSVPKAGDVAGLPKVQSCPPDALNESGHSNVRHISFPMWCSKLITLVLRTRTAFASFLAFSISTARLLSSRTPSSPTLFPIAAAFIGMLSIGCLQGTPAVRRRAIGLAACSSCDLYGSQLLALWRQFCG